MKCLTLSRIIAFQNELLSSSEHEKISKHLESCPECQKKLKEYKASAALMQKVSPLEHTLDRTRCFTEDQLLYFLEESRPSPAHRQYEHHFAECRQCTDQLVSLETFLYDLKTAGLLSAEKSHHPHTITLQEQLKNRISDKINSWWNSFRVPRLAYQMAGFAVILIMLITLLDYQGIIKNHWFPTREPSLIETTASLNLLSPSDHSLVNSSELQFNWSSISGATSYTFLLLNEQGDILWEEQTPRTALSLPEEIQLQPSTVYFWQVECQFEAGGSLTSDMSSFSMKYK